MSWQLRVRTSDADDGPRIVEIPDHQAAALGLVLAEALRRGTETLGWPLEASDLWEETGVLAIELRREPAAEGSER